MALKQDQVPEILIISWDLGMEYKSNAVIIKISLTAMTIIKNKPLLQGKLNNSHFLPDCWMCLLNFAEKAGGKLSKK